MVDSTAGVEDDVMEVSGSVGEVGSEVAKIDPGVVSGPTGIDGRLVSVTKVAPGVVGIPGPVGGVPVAKGGSVGSVGSAISSTFSL